MKCIIKEIQTEILFFLLTILSLDKNDQWEGLVNKQPESPHSLESRGAVMGGGESYRAFTAPKTYQFSFEQATKNETEELCVSDFHPVTSVTERHQVSPSVVSSEEQFMNFHWDLFKNHLISPSAW